jgi:uncharacterized OB-fold protein
VTDKPLPQPDRDSAPYWEGIAAGELRLQRCMDCGAWRWPARAICNRCRSFAAEWVEASGLGTIVSWIRTHQLFIRSFADEVPYVTVEVRLDEQADIRLIGRLAEPSIKPEIGMRVRAEFTKDPALVLWRPMRK